MDVSILIASWNTRNLLADCLDSILVSSLEQPNKQVETIIVDNASEDGSLEMICSSYPWVKLYPSTENLGYGRANNLAAAHADGKYLMLLNPDTILHPGALWRMVEYMDAHPQVGAVGPRLCNVDGSTQLSAHPTPTLLRETWHLLHLDPLYPLSAYPVSYLTPDSPHPVEVIKGACILLRQDIVEQVGLFDEQFFMYSEEVDLCLRMRKAGWEIHWLPLAEVTHLGGQSTRQAADAMFLELYRNKVRFFRKHQGKITVLSFKAVLYILSTARWLTASLLIRTQSGRQSDWSKVSRQYRLLLDEMPTL